MYTVQFTKKMFDAYLKTYFLSKNVTNKLKLK